MKTTYPQRRFSVFASTVVILAVATLALNAAFVQNPSSEDSAPGVTPINRWTGGSGVNDSSGPSSVLVIPLGTTA